MLYHSGKTLRRTVKENANATDAAAAATASAVIAAVHAAAGARVAGGADGAHAVALVPPQRDDRSLSRIRRLDPADRLAVVVIVVGGGGGVYLAAAAAARADPVLGVAKVVKDLVLRRPFKDGPGRWNGS